MWGGTGWSDGKGAPSRTQHPSGGTSCSTSQLQVLALGCRAQPSPHRAQHTCSLLFFSPFFWGWDLFCIQPKCSADLLAQPRTVTTHPSPALRSAKIDRSLLKANPSYVTASPTSAFRKGPHKEVLGSLARTDPSKLTRSSQAPNLPQNLPS